MSFYFDVLKQHPHFTLSQRCAEPMLLEPVTRAAVEAVIADAAAMGISLMIFESFRSQARQQQLFDAGATQLKSVGVHNFGLAADLVRSVNGEPSWKGDFTFLAKLAKKHGLIWGGDWNAPPPHHFVDAVHVQRCSVARQAHLFAEAWYPDGVYDPYTG
jgi:hypothetical protein